jgi:hypothetical protein
VTRLLFALAVLLSAALTFTVQPLVGKQLLPLAGGTPGVWNTCLVFFQAMLLLGYLTAHVVTTKVHGVGRQVAVHAAVLLLAVAVLMLGGLLKPNESLLPADAETPVGYLLLMLTVAVGLPFLALSATAPLLQAWFARGGGNPYPLYAASNLGSFGGLIAYPLLVEPTFTLADQRWMWAVGFGVCAVLVLACGQVGRMAISPSGERKHPESDHLRGLTLPARVNQLHWLFLAALPSSLLLSVTTHLSTDIAPMPLLWVIPLGLYLLTFVVAFGQWPPAARRLVGRVAPMGLCFVCVVLLTRANQPMAMVAAVHLGAFTVVALLCHGELAALKPPPEQLTHFYLWVAAGGVVGGLVNALLAPVLFGGLGYVEYPLALVLAALVRPPGKSPDAPFGRWDWAMPLVLLAGTAGLTIAGQLFPKPPADDPATAMLLRLLRGGLTFGLPCVVAFTQVKRPVRFALCLAAVLVVGQFSPTEHGRTLETARNFFGTLRVTESDDGQFRRLVHGTTQHGQQKVSDIGRPAPTMYYHRKGPLGHLFEVLPAERKRRVGAVGLGVGASAAYAEAGDDWTFYEIDPAVVRIAKDERYFTFLSTCPARWEVVLGDARRQLANAADGSFDVLILDAFNSDAVPVHLLTREAMELYLRKLGPRGVVAFHVSNNFLELPELVERVAHAAQPTLEVRYNDGLPPTDADRASGYAQSHWVLIARTAADLPTRPDGRSDFRWQPMQPRPGPVWTDDFSSLLGVWRREER